MKTIAIIPVLASALVLAGCSEEPGNEQIGAAPPTGESSTVSTQEGIEEDMPTPTAVAEIPSNVDIPSTLTDIEDATEAPAE